VEPLARKAAETVVTVVDDEGLYLLIAELMRSLGDSQVDIFFYTFWGFFLFGNNNSE
jgi:hypothetical protein